MNTRSIALSLAAAVGICFAASQLKANDPIQPEEVTQDVCEPVACHQCGEERADLPAWMICEGWMPYEEIIAVDEVIEPAVANENEAQEADETFAETIKDKDLIQEFKCVEGFDGWIVERDLEAEGLTEEKDESLESEPVVGEETVQVDAAVQIFEEAATDESETTEEEIFANEELTGGSIWIAVFDANFDAGGFDATDTDEDVASPVVVETLDDVSSLQQAIEEPQDAAADLSTASEGDNDNVEERVFESTDIDADEFATIDVTDSVVEIDETLEVIEPQVEGLELQETAIESTTVDEVNELEVRTVRTIELGGCKITIQSERQMDEFELLNLLWEAVDQLEAEMD